MAVNVSVLKNKAFRFFNRTMQRNSNLLFRGILDTPPIRTDPECHAVMYTMLDQANYRAYLLAAKSFLRFCPPIAVVVQNDGTLSDTAIGHLRDHLPGVLILGRAETIKFVGETVNRETLAQLGFEPNCDLFVKLRYLNIIHKFTEKKIIVFDSDLLFLREPTFVLEWLDSKRVDAFHSDGGSGQGESFHKLGLDFSKVDINRFNAGFTGFFNNVRPETVSRIVAHIYERNEPLLHEYEIEQSLWSVTFNYFEKVTCLEDVAKDYVGSSFWPYGRMKQSVLVHFIGSKRFKDLSYLRLARDVVHDLKSLGERTAASTR